VLHTQTLNDFSRSPCVAVVAVLRASWAIGPCSIDLHLPALPTLGADLGASRQPVALTTTAPFLVARVGLIIATSTAPALAGILALGVSAAVAWIDRSPVGACEYQPGSCAGVTVW
jgi:hypothetical protein